MRKILVFALFCDWFASAVCLDSEIFARIRKRINATELSHQINHLAIFSSDPDPAVTRILFTQEDIAARGFIKDLMHDAGLTVREGSAGRDIAEGLPLLREDEVGNIFGRLQGLSHGVVMSGSHCDAIPLSGKYDGTVGVLGAIMAIKAIRLSGLKLFRSLEVVMFTSEEPTRFGVSCIGSRAMTGNLEANDLTAMKGADGLNFMQAAGAVGYAASQNTTEALHSAQNTITNADYFIELHIEQGPLLEQAGRKIGIVQAIAAPAALMVTFTGDGGHAGSQLMHLRNDVSLAAAELAMDLEKEVLSLRTEDAVATVGRWLFEPNTVNSVPRKAQLEIDVRDTKKDRRDHMVDFVLRDAQRIASHRKVKVTTSVITQDPPAKCSEDVQGVVETVADAVVGKHGSMHMVSRAYHDSLFIAQKVPTGMVFIPCAHGHSHRPDESASEEDMGIGVQVLAGTIAQLAAGEEDAEMRVNRDQ